MTIDASQYDFVNSLEDRKTVLKSIDDKLLEIGKIDEDEYASLMLKLERMQLDD